MERINDKENCQVYDTMIAKRREEKDECASKMEDIKKYGFYGSKTQSRVQSKHTYD